MSFVHDDSEFGELLRIVASDSGLSNALVEKDYWVTHSLWAIQETKLEVWLKGGTSLSKGFALIQRFSEDLDLRIEPGAQPGVPAVKSWKSANKGPVSTRRAFYEAIERVIAIPGAPLELDPDSIDKHARGASYRVRYPGKFTDELHPDMRPFVLLEIGTARVTPFVELTISSLVHDWLKGHDRDADYEDNRPKTTRCTHPLVTLVEKADAIVRRHAHGREPASYIRHYEDMARIIQKRKHLPALEINTADLVQDMVAQGQVHAIPSPDDPAFTLADADRRAELLKANDAITPMFWGERLSFGAACRIVREWLDTLPRQ